MAAAQEILKGFTAKSLKSSFLNKNLRVRIGINSGEVVLSRTSRDYGAQYKVTGEAVHIADRMLKLAGPNRAVISEYCKTDIEKFYKLRSVAQLKWHGKPLLNGAQNGTKRGTINLELANLGERQRWFLRNLHAGRTVTALSICQRWHVGLRTARRDIAALKEKGVIRFVGAKKVGRYELM